mmetsp:Transcript_26690/g.77674  ORF Transcript_26690/g.77674 Transcript_26690/m.77674 type:complete len:210 (+) Transcript_26690:142-771(+)
MGTLRLAKDRIQRASVCLRSRAHAVATRGTMLSSSYTTSAARMRSNPPASPELIPCTAWISSARPQNRRVTRASGAGGEATGVAACSVLRANRWTAPGTDQSSTGTSGANPLRSKFSDSRVSVSSSPSVTTVEAVPRAEATSPTRPSPAPSSMQSWSRRVARIATRYLQSSSAPLHIVNPVPPTAAVCPSSRATPRREHSTAPGPSPKM